MKLQEDHSHNHLQYVSRVIIVHNKSTLDSGIDIGQGINVGPGKFGKEINIGP